MCPPPSSHCAQISPFLSAPASAFLQDLSHFLFAPTITTIARLPRPAPHFVSPARCVSFHPWFFLSTHTLRTLHPPILLPPRRQRTAARVLSQDAHTFCLFRTFTRLPRPYHWPFSFLSNTFASCARNLDCNPRGLHAAQPSPPPHPHPLSSRTPQTHSYRGQRLSYFFQKLSLIGPHLQPLSLHTHAHTQRFAHTRTHTLPPPCRLSLHTSI